MKLLVEQGELAGQEFALARPMITLGRGQENDVVLLEHGVSRQHARFQQTPQGWMLTDLGSTNGTFVNSLGRQIRLQPHEAYLLHPGDRVMMGNAVLAIQEATEPPAPRPAFPGPGPAPEERPKPRAALMVAGAILLVVVLVGIVALLVVVLQPKDEEVVTPTSGSPVEEVMTSLPVPTELQDVVTSIVPLLPTGLLGPFGPQEETPTPPPPGAAAPAEHSALIAAPGGNP